MCLIEIYLRRASSFFVITITNCHATNHIFPVMTTVVAWMTVLVLMVWLLSATTTITAFFAIRTFILTVRYCDYGNSRWWSVIYRYCVLSSIRRYMMLVIWLKQKKSVQTMVLYSLYFRYFANFIILKIEERAFSCYVIYLDHAYYSIIIWEPRKSPNKSLSTFRLAND